MEEHNTYAREVFIFAVACLVGSLVVKPSFPRWIFFIGSLSMTYLYTTTSGSMGFDVAIAPCGIWFLLTASDMILLSEPQREFRWVRQKQTEIENAPFGARLQWGLRLFSSMRGVGWNFEPKIFRPRAARGTSRISFLMKHVGAFFLWLIARDIATLYVGQSPAFTKEGIPLTGRLVHSLVCLVSVTLHLSRPEDWTHSFGYWGDAYTIRRLWGRTWHQLLRRFLSAHGKFVSRRVLHLQPGTNASSYVQLYVAFFLSGVIHSVCEPMRRDFHFFLLQAVAITLEDGIIAIGKKLGVRQGRAIHILGYLWVATWFYHTLPIWWEPMRRVDLWDTYSDTALPAEWYARLAGLVD
ncbi:hypothetical protein BDZ89DRAFT_1062878, partial [Hymenopellis radicata]